MKFNSKAELEKYIIRCTIPSELELKSSPVGGKGLYAKVFIPKGKKFSAIYLGKGYNKIPALKRYTWLANGTIYGGIGYYCNGSCNEFMKHEVGTKLGPYNIVHPNMELINDFFITTQDIPSGVELILNYGDQYFYCWNNEGNLDYNKLIIDGNGTWLDLTKPDSYSNRIKMAFSI